MAGLLQQIGGELGEAAGEASKPGTYLIEQIGMGPAVGAASRLATGKSASSQATKEITKAATSAGEAAGKAGDKAAGSVLPGIEAFVLKVALNGALLLAGLALVVYGVMVAVRPRESAFSIPTPPIPIPV
jgi:hypothetical protein